VAIQCPRIADSVVAAANRHPASVLQKADHALKAFPPQGRPGLPITQKKHERVGVKSGDLELAPDPWVYRGVRQVEVLPVQPGPLAYSMLIASTKRPKLPANLPSIQIFPPSRPS
jgi:hypothetical protein